MSESQQKENIFIQIRRIKQLSFLVDENDVKMMPKANIQLDFKSSFNLELKALDCVLRIIYLNPETDKWFIQTEVQTVYGIINIEKFLDENNLPDLPTNVLLFITGSLVAHTRALLASSLAGTVYTNLLLPVVDTVVLAKQFFGDKIKEEELYTPEIGISAAELQYQQ